MAPLPLFQAPAAFVPTNLSKVKAWLRLAERTDTGTLTIPDMLSANPATQGTPAEKPTFSTSNGFPIMTFDGTDDSLQLPIHAGTITATKFGFHCWLRPRNGGDLLSILLPDAGTSRYIWRPTALQRLYGTGSVQNIIPDAFPSLSSWYFGSWEYDGTQSTDTDRVRLHYDAATQTFTDTTAGGGDFIPADVPLTTGSITIGGKSVYFDADVGPNIYATQGYLTAGELANLMAFEPPV